MAMNLQLAEYGKASPLPDWAQWFIDLGKEVRSLSSDEERLTVAVSVPHRGFAALLIALGITERSFDLEVEHAEGPAGRLANLEPGTAISLLDTHDQFRFARVTQVIRDGNDRVTALKYLRNQQGTAPQLIGLPIEMCASLELVSDEATEFHHPRDAALDPAFVRAVVGVSNFERFVSHNRLSSLVVGPVKELLGEIHLKRFSSPTAPGVEGCLLDLLRPRFGNQDQPQHRSLPARTHVVRSTGEDLIDRSAFLPLACTVFDGGNGYVRNRDAAVGNTVVVLDRWAARAAESVDVFRQDLASSLKDADLRVFKRPPAGTEVVGFWGRR